ncbi:hypothetical protein QJS04_geneDACA006653 [Acorus gramineus]|uniref:Uncharacterized protein n=1 Tax=Acorus gramineus TaxID=55184 RepID=A0AAV9AXF4_ACOGR|nr:hypothetical protein QJS04_geneDACA006653 [Acorus gramineus]
MKKKFKINQQKHTKNQILAIKEQQEKLLLNSPNNLQFDSSTTWAGRGGVGG